MKKTLLLLVLFIGWHTLFAQEAEKKDVIRNFSGTVSVTNKGISIIPLFTLGKPAAIIEMSLGKKLTFDPQLRFGLNGKPWSFVFWLRHQLVNNERFTLRVGAHPSFVFSEATDTTGGIHENYMKTARYLAGEIAPAWSLTQNISLGLYYLVGHGLEEHLTQYTHYLAFMVNFSHIGITDKVYLRLNPQVYYLNLDKEEGFYTSGVISLAAKDFPLSVSYMFNKTIKTDIAADDFSWNVSLTYAFRHSYARQ